jgi:hypothetical protein
LSLQEYRAMFRPQFHCSDADVRAFVSEEFLRIGVYTNPEFVMTAREILAEAHKRFGKRAADLEFWIQ